MKGTKMKISELCKELNEKYDTDIFTSEFGDVELGDDAETQWIQLKGRDEIHVEALIKKMEIGAVNIGNNQLSISDLEYIVHGDSAEELRDEIQHLREHISYLESESEENANEVIALNGVKKFAQETILKAMRGDTNG